MSNMKTPSDQFKINPELLESAIIAFYGGSSILLSNLKQEGDGFISISDDEFEYMVTANTVFEYAEIKFMLACFVLLAAGEDI